MTDAPTPPDNRDRPEERDSHEPAPRRLTRWIWLVAIPGFYLASFLAAVALDQFDLVPPSLYPLLRGIFFPFEFLAESSSLFRSVIEAFANLFRR